MAQGAFLTHQELGRESAGAGGVGDPHDLALNFFNGMGVPLLCCAEKICMAVIVFCFCGGACLASPAG